MNNTKKISYTILLTFLTLNLFGILNLMNTPLKKSDLVDYSDNSNNDNETPFNLKSSAFDFDLVPTVSSQYFSPNGDGKKDNVIYSFSPNQNSNYTLNISEYYEPLLGYTGSTSLSDMEGAGYLMVNGTWLVAGFDLRVELMQVWIVLGIGTNASNFNWIDVGYMDAMPNKIAVAGDESGKIRIVYYELNSPGRSTDGLKYWDSNDWGKSWSNGTIKTYGINPNLEIRGISLTAYM
ncbi:hypothetical protein LCGC14_0864260 [marine sediment metagenome]|uniref:Uncharacterized protein n=1 Tax=marine sediment metagenome TaxID=412755 RepID=A0A0F9P6H0_9ZZZZ